MPINYKSWAKKQEWSVNDAVLLLLGIEPGGDYPPSNLDAAQRISHQKILRAANRDLGTKLPTAWQSISPVIPGTPDNYPHVLVAPGDWIAWAKKLRFPIPKQLLSINDALVITPSLQQRRLSEVEMLLKKISSAAKKEGEHFDRAYMPGTKDQLKRLIKTHCPSLRDLQGPTLDTYIKNAGCKFSPGAGQQSTTLWKRFGLV